MEKPRVALVALDALIPNYHEVQEWTSSALRREGYEVSLLGCRGALRRCVNINSQPVPLDHEGVREFKKNNCANCFEKQSEIAHDAAAFVSDTDILDEKQRDFIEDLRQTLLGARKISSVLGRHWFGLAVTDLAFFDFCIVQKVSQFTTLEDVQIAIYLEMCEDVLQIGNFIDRANQELRSEFVLYTNGNMTQNSVFREKMRGCAEAHSIEHVFSCPTFLNRIFIEPDRVALEQQWGAIRRARGEGRVSLRDVRRALNVFWNRYQGNDFNSYTSLKFASGARPSFESLRSSYRRLHSIFLSSSDELNSHIIAHGFTPDTSLFLSQRDFILSLRKNLSPETAYVIRVHPRLAPNKREKLRSKELEEISEELAELAKLENVLVIYPDDLISSYYIMLRSDLVIVTWSTIGLEALVGGKPCLSAFPGNLMYPISSLCAQPSNRDVFFRLLRDSRGQPPIDDSKIAEWIGLVYGASSFPVPTPRRDSRNFFFRVLYRLHRIFFRYTVLKRPFFALFNAMYASRLVKMMTIPIPAVSDVSVGIPESFSREIRAWRSVLARKVLGDVQG